MKPACESPAVSSVIRFLDGNGFAWTVFELRGDNPDAVGDCLYFLSRGSTLRLGRYPDDWAQLDWGGLDRLRLRADVMSDDVTRQPLRWRTMRRADSASVA